MIDPYISPYSAVQSGRRWVFFHVCMVVAICALLANFLPDSETVSKRLAILLREYPRLQGKICWWYEFFIDVVALIALNIRAEFPCLEVAFMGFRRNLRHGIRNWKQERMDREYGEAHREN